MKTATITFDQTFVDGEGNIGDQVNHTAIAVSVDGEAVIFEFPDGLPVGSWACDQPALLALLHEP